MKELKALEDEYMRLNQELAKIGMKAVMALPKDTRKEMVKRLQESLTDKE